jgi:hypothetical protein
MRGRVRSEEEGGVTSFVTNLTVKGESRAEQMIASGFPKEPVCFKPMQSSIHSQERS